MQHKIKCKKLYNKAIKAMKSLEAVRVCNWLSDLQFESQHHDVQTDLFGAIDSLKSFIENIDNSYFNNPNW